MRISFFVLLNFLILHLMAQTNYQIKVCDSRSKEPMPYCNAIIEGSSKGAMTNNEGIILLNLNKQDVVVFSYLGYETKRINVSGLTKGNTVYLVAKSLSINEVVVRPGTDYLYDFFTKCRKKLTGFHNTNSSKVYYAVESQSTVEPLELIECYFNGTVRGVGLEKLEFRNGRVGFAKVSDNFFLTKHTSRAFEILDITNDNGYFPLVPLQCSKNKLKDFFLLEFKSIDGTIYNISFTPKKECKSCFSGELWIDTKEFDLLKIKLEIDSAEVHPFLPQFDCDSLFNVSLSIMNSYKKEGDNLVPEYFNLDYSFDYQSLRDTTIVLKYKKITRKISSKGLMYFYDYETPFIIPYFEYNQGYDDYRKISMIPFNEVFWNHNKTMLLTNSQKEKVEYFHENGNTYNFREDNYGHNFSIPDGYWEAPALFEYYLSFWSPNKRIILAKENENNKPYPPEIINQNILSNLYNIKVQILLDLTQLHDSIYCKSFTVFDGFSTYFHLPEEIYTRAFLNIYFDICEIERRKLEKELNSGNFSLNEINAIYNKAIANMNKTTSTFLKEANLGRDFSMLKKWNTYVFNQLKIDNIMLVDNTNKGKK